MLKVAVIIERADTALGGAERSVSELAAELRRQGAEAAILAAKGTPSENTIILCEDYPGKRIPLKVFEKALQKHLREHTYDIVHSTLPLAIADVYQPRGGCYREAMLRNIASYPSSCQRTLKHWTHRLNLHRTQYLDAEKKLCTQTHVTIAVLSHYVKTHFQKHYNLPDNRIAVIPNGVDTNIQSDIKKSSEIKEEILKSVTLQPNKPPVIFLFAANNPRLKGLRELLMAFEDIAFDAYVHPILIVVGTKGLGPYEELSKALLLKNHLAVFGSQDNIFNMLSISDVTVLPTYYDPCSRFVLESLAVGKPVITTRYNGAAERFVNHLHGVTINEPDYPLLADGLSYFCELKNIELAQRAIVEDNLKDEVSITKHVGALMGLYEKIPAKKER